MLNINQNKIPLHQLLIIRRIYIYLFLLKYFSARNRTIDIPVWLYNYGGASLTGLTLETQAGTGITAGIINNGDTVLYPGENQNITLRVTSSSSTPDNSWASMKATLAEGFQKTLNANITIVQLIPVITTSPSYIDTGMVRGNQKIATFNISNAGEETLRNARIEGPSTSWMTLTINKAIGDVQPGVSKTVGIMFNPSSTLAQGVYDDRVVIYSDNHIPYTYHIQVTVTSNAVGNVMFDVLNELMEDVPGATITLQHQLLTELIYTLKTAADGSVMLYDIPEGRYTYNVSPPPGHTPYSGTFTISPGLTTTVPIALEMTMVTVTWSVTPTVIQDKYEIVVTQTFETNVPAPVLVIEPPNINLPALQPGQVFNGEFKVTNYGLIEVYDVVLDFPRSIDDYDIEVMTSAIPSKIGAMKSITVPYRITRRVQTASASLFDEVMGYGGSTCVKTFNVTVKAKCVICPNTAYQRIVEKLANYFVSIQADCPSSVTSGATSPSTYTGGGGSVTVLPPNYVQGGEGGGISGYSPAIVPMGDCKCMICDDKNPCTDDFCEAGICMHIPNNKPCSDDGNACTNDICSGGACTHPAKADNTPCPDDGKWCTEDYCQNGQSTHPNINCFNYASVV